MVKLKMGMIGGGMGSFIGAIHRNAAFLDNKIELVSGCFSSSFENSLQTGNDLYLDKDRVYKSFEEMLSKESTLSKSCRCCGSSSPKRTNISPFSNFMN